MTYSHSPVPSLVKHCCRESKGFNCPHRRCLSDQESVSALTAALCFIQNIPATCAWGSHGITLQSWACHGAGVRNKRWHCPGKFIVQHLEPLLLNDSKKLCKGSCQVLFNLKQHSNSYKIYHRKEDWGRGLVGFTCTNKMLETTCTIVRRLILEWAFNRIQTLLGRDNALTPALSCFSTWPLFPQDTILCTTQAQQISMSGSKTL